MLKTVLFTVCMLAGACGQTLSQDKSSPSPKSASTATKYSLYGTIVPAVAGGAMILSQQSSDEPFGEGWVVPGLILGWMGATAGPGLGHAYAGRWWHLVKGSVFRSVGAALIISGLLGPDPSGMGGWREPQDEDKDTDGAAIVVGSAIYLWSTIHDLRTLDDAVERYNQKHAGVTVSVSPTYFADQDAPGIAVSVGF